MVNKYYLSHKELFLKKQKEYRKRHRVEINKKNNEYRSKDKEKWRKYALDWKKRHLDECRRRNLDWKRNHIIMVREKQKEWRRVQRLEALSIVGDGVMRCSRCGCDNVKCLQINHLLPVFKTEDKGELRENLYRKIIKGQVPKEAFNILCGTCNWCHYFEHKFGLKWKINFDSNRI